jgi:hypothetical protein
MSLGHHGAPFFAEAPGSLSQCASGFDKGLVDPGTKLPLAINCRIDPVCHCRNSSLLRIGNLDAIWMRTGLGFRGHMPVNSLTSFFPVM